MRFDKAHDYFPPALLLGLLLVSLVTRHRRQRFRRASIFSSSARTREGE